MSEALNIGLLVTIVLAVFVLAVVAWGIVLEICSAAHEWRRHRRYVRKEHGKT